MAALSNLAIKAGESAMLFDGILTDGKTRHYVEGVPFVTLAVGNYQTKQVHDVGNSIWIQTESAAAHNVWYELGTPAPEYERYYKPFVWLANFSKHFM
jgi:DNA (cytosine-5)-methyltransferase 1